MEYIFFGIMFFINYIQIRYELFKRLFHIKTYDIFGYSKIAFLSGMIASTFTNPFWTINTKMTLQKVKIFNN